MHNSDLSQTNLEHAVFSSTNLFSANVNGSDLAGAYLKGVHTGSLFGAPSSWQLSPAWKLYAGYPWGPGVARGRAPRGARHVERLRLPVRGPEPGWHRPQERRPDQRHPEGHEPRGCQPRWHHAHRGGVRPRGVRRDHGHPGCVAGRCQGGERLPPRPARVPGRRQPCRAQPDGHEPHRGRSHRRQPHGDEPDQLQPLAERASGTRIGGATFTSAAMVGMQTTA